MMTYEPNPLHNNETPLPTIGRRVWAKLLDYVALSLIVGGISTASGSYLLGVMVGYTWFLSTDSFGGFGKLLLGLRTVGLTTGSGCTFRQSLVRNALFVAPVLPVRLHQGILELSRQEYMDRYGPWAILASAVILGWWIREWKAMEDDPSRRRIGDRWAGTLVVRSSRAASREAPSQVEG